MNPYKRLDFWALSISIFLILFGILVDASSRSLINDNGLGSDQTLDFVVVGGNALSSLSNPINPLPKVVKTLPVVVTAYSSTPGQTDDTPFITASGSTVRKGIVANNLLPFGTKIRMPEIYGEVILTVEDRMSRKKSNYHIDVWFSDYHQALAFGAKNTHIEVLEL
jgi:3D (Asp-Asp-Asp) domain-containing protein